MCYYSRQSQRHNLRHRTPYVPDTKTPRNRRAASRRAPPRWSGITPRAWIIGLLLIPILDFWLEYTEIVAAGPDLAAMSLPMAVLFALLVLIGINLGVKKFRPKLALTQAELLFIYTMNTVAIYIGGIGMMQFLTPTLVGWKYYATKENKWENWHHFIPPWAVPDGSVAKDYYKGQTTLFTPEHLLGLGRAGRGLDRVHLHAAVLLLLHRRPAAAAVGGPGAADLPHRPDSRWRSRATAAATRSGPTACSGWASGIPVVLESLAAIHFTLIPTFPVHPDQARIQPAAGTGHQDAALERHRLHDAGLLPAGHRPDLSAVAGRVVLLLVLLPVYQAAKCRRDLVRLPRSGRGTDPGEHALYRRAGRRARFSAWPCTRWFWPARSLPKPGARRSGARRTWTTRPSRCPYRAAYIGLFVSSALLVGFGVALGLSLWVSLVFWVLLLLLALTFTRIRAEAGLPWGQAPYNLTHGNMVHFAGTEAFSPRELTAFSFVRWFDSDWRCLGQPAEIEAMKIADSTGPRPMNPRHLTAAVFVAILVGCLAAWVSCLGIYYHFGAASAHVNDWRTGQGHYGFDELQGWLNAPKSADTARITRGRGRPGHRHHSWAFCGRASPGGRCTPSATPWAARTR